MAMSKHVRAALAGLARAPEPAQYYNPGVCRKLMVEGWATDTLGPAVSKAGAARGDRVSYLEITDAGRAALEAERAKPNRP